MAIQVGGSNESLPSGLPALREGEGYFTENIGQWDERFSFVGTTAFGKVAFAKSGWILDVHTDGGGDVVSYELAGRQAYPIGSEKVPGSTNYIFGDDPTRWVVGASSFRCVTYENVWDGIDIRFIQGHYLEYDIIVPSGSDLSKIVIGLKGQRHISVSGDRLEIAIGNGSIIETIPKAYYLDRPNDPVPAQYRSLDGDRFSFLVPDRDPDRTLIIDPLIYSTYLGSSVNDGGKAVDIDGKGCCYITGTTQSTSFPTTSGAYDTTHNGGKDVFVSKFDPTGSNLIYSTFMGGTDSTKIEEGLDLTVDPSGNVTVLADTNCNDFPTTSGAYDTSYNGNGDAVVFCLNSTGMGLTFSTFIGGSNMDSGDSLDLDDHGNVYIVGDTFSSDMPTTSGAYDTSLTGTVDIFVAKIDCTGTNLLFLTYLGQDAYAGGIVQDSTGVYVSGSTWTSGHPTTSGAYDRTSNGGNDIFVTKFDTKGTTLIYSTYIGGSTHDYASGIDVDANGNACLSGTTWSNNFPTTSGAYDTTSNNIHSNGIVLKLNATGASLVFSTYLGGSGTLGEVLRDVSLDSSGNVYVAGDTDSLNFPTTTGAYDTTHSGSGSDCVLSVLNNAGTILAYSTFFGGTSSDYCYGIERDKDGDVILTGQTTSTDFPTSTGSYDTIQNGWSDAFILCLNFSVSLPPSPPINVTGSMGRGFITLSWEDPEYDGGSKVICFAIFRGGMGGAWTRIGSVGPTSHGYNDSTVEIGKSQWYFITCNNSAGTSLPSQKVLITDERSPSIRSVEGDAIAITGKSYIVTATVHDNIVIQAVWCKYWYGTGDNRTSEMIEDSFDVWRSEFVIEDTSLALHLRIVASDPCGNIATSSIFNVTVHGPVLPVISEDGSDDVAYTGDPFTLMTRVEDNFGIRKVYASVAGISNKDLNITLEEEGASRWIGSIDIPPDQAGTIAYKFSATDINGNWNSTMFREVDVIDNDPPQFRTDMTSSSCTTGSMSDFIVSYHDNIDVESVVLNYTWDDTFAYEREMTFQSAGYWRTSVRVLDSASSLEYHTQASDAQGNTASSGVRDLIVTDMEWPEIVSDLSPIDATCGQYFEFRIEARDNRVVDKVLVEYWFGEGGHGYVRCEGSSALFTGTIAIPFDSIDPLLYLVHVSDPVGNENITDTRSVTVFDRTVPTLGRVPDVVCLLGQTVCLHVDPFDNIGIASVVWEGARLSVQDDSFEWTTRKPGIHQFNVTAWDRSENYARSFFNITVLNATGDSDGDGITDSMEIVTGLDPHDARDASLDRDSDGLTNLDEFLRGTDISDDDTDLDGMPDGWEVRYGLDPKSFSSEKDTDGDGTSDLNEYLGSTDPTVMDRAKGNERTAWKTVLSILLLFSATVIICVSIFISFRAKRGIPPAQPSSPAGVQGEMFVQPAEPGRKIEDIPSATDPPQRPTSVDDWLEAALKEYGRDDPSGPIDLGPQPPAVPIPEDEPIRTGTWQDGGDK